MPEKMYDNSHNMQNVLQSFINHHRNSLQKLEEQNQKLAQDNSSLNAEVTNNEGTIMALNEKIAASEKEIAKYKEEQLHLTENKKLLRSELMEYKKRCTEIIIYSENEKAEMQQTFDKLQNELKERDAKELVLENELDAIRQELQTKTDECTKSNEELTLSKTEINVNKKEIEELEKSLTILKDELKEKDETIEKLRKEYAHYKMETEKNINKMQEVQRIIYPNASNPLPRTNQENENRSTLPSSALVKPRSQSRCALKRSSATSSLDSDSEIDNEVLRGWRQHRNQDESEQYGFNVEKTEISETSESAQHMQLQRRKRRRH